jgi:hypothetical protein
MLVAPLLERPCRPSAPAVGVSAIVSIFTAAAKESASGASRPSVAWEQGDLALTIGEQPLEEGRA